MLDRWAYPILLLMVCAIIAILVVTHDVRTKGTPDDVQISLKTQLQEKTEAAENLGRMLATCMNGGTLIDKRSNIAYFCGKVIPVDLSPMNLVSSK